MIEHELVDPVFSGRLCLTLLHSVWQVALVTLAAWVIDRLWRKRSVEWSYALHAAALFVALAVMPLTYVLIDVADPPNDAAIGADSVGLVPGPQASAVDSAPEAVPAAPTTVAQTRQASTEGDLSATSEISEPTVSPPATRSAQKRLPSWLHAAPWVVALYVAGVAVMFARLILAIVKANRLGAHARLVADGPLAAVLRSLARDWSMNVVPALAQAERIIVPQVVGLLRPTILLPASALSGLSIDDLEMILAHELAHVRRHDTWVNLLQRLAETFLFFNPALWYLSRRISTLREYCCDDVTCRAQSASDSQPRLRYAAALLRIVELSMPNTTTNRDLAALAASGRSPSELRRRVARLCGEGLREPVRLSRGGLLAFAAITLLLVCCPALWPTRKQTTIVAATTAQKGEATDATTTKESSSNSDAEDVGRKGPVLRGRIVDDSSNPLHDVQVILFDGSAIRFGFGGPRARTNANGIAVPFRGQEAKTNANGEYRFDPPKTGGRMSSDKGGSSFWAGVEFKHSQYVPADGKSWRGIEVPLLDRHETVLDLTMTLGGKVSGIVLDSESGEPVPELDLRIHNGFIDGNKDSEFLTYVTTDGAGGFTSDPVFPGQYVIDINNGDYQGKYHFPKIGRVVVKAGETAELRMITRERPDLQDPFRILGTAIGDDGQTMMYGGVGLRIAGSDNRLRTRGGGIDGRNVFGLTFGPIERTESSENSPYGVGTHDVELFGINERFGYKLVARAPSEPLRITDDPNRRELEDGIRYIRPNQTVEFQLVFARSDDTSRLFQLNVVGPDGSPVANAGVEIRASPAVTAEQIRRGEFVRSGRYGTFATTDEDGQLAVRLPRRPERFSISIKQAGYAPYWTGWNSGSHPQDVPNEFTAHLDKGWSVGGVVVDGNGTPVEGAEVKPSVYYKKRPGDTSQLGVGTRIRTDSEGKWRFDSVPVSKSDVHVEVSHPDYQPLRRRLARNGFEVKPDATSTAHIELKRGLTVTGTVTDESGQPIEGALVRTKFLNDIREATTDKRGSYRLAGCEPRAARIVVSAKGRATDMREVRVDPEMDPVNFSMKPGGRIRVRVVDEQGKGIPRARVFFQHWRGRIDYFEFDHVSQYADENGVWEWNEAPLDEFKADICRPGGMQLSEQSLIAREEEYVFKPPIALVVSGSVVDAKTKEPIKRFRVIPGLRNSDPRIRMNWIPRDSYEASDGKYRIRLTDDYPAHLVRIEAEGYQVAISRDIMTDEGKVDFDFELQPADDIAATILTAAGEPAAHAKMALGVTGSQISIQNGDINERSTYATRLDADARGRFSIPARDEPFQLVIMHSSGFAHLKSTDGPTPGRITLTPWARVEGTFRVGADPAPNVVLSISAEGIHSYGDDVPNISTRYEATTGEDGRFVFERVVPGKGRIGRRILLMVDEGATEVTSSQRVSAEFIAGKTTTLDLGGTGRPVVGRLMPPVGHAERVFWNFALVEVRADLQRPPAPKAPADIRDDADRYEAWWEAWMATDEGKAWTAAYRAYQELQSQYPYITASVDRDGSFRIDDVPSGDYVLHVRFSRKAPGVLSERRFSVPHVEEGRIAEPVELGVLTLDKQ